MKKLIVFDLDGTLAESKSAIDAEMSKRLTALLRTAKVAVISGGAWPQFEHQLLAKLARGKHLKLLSILPTCGSQFYTYDRGWKLLYAENFTVSERTTIMTALTDAIGTMHFKIKKFWGDAIEDRGSQITYSALGQHAPLAQKKKWDPDFAKRKKLKAMLDQRLRGFAVRLGGTTSVDITRKGIDKAYGIRKLRDTLGVAIDEMIFVGDALFPGGNDHPARTAGVTCIQVKDPNETKHVIEAFVACLSSR